MIDINEWLRELGELEDTEIKDRENYQKQLFEEYVLQGMDFLEERKRLYRAYQDSAELTGTKGLRKQLAAFDLAYFGRAYLPHYFVRKSPRFHQELDDIWKNRVLKGRNPVTHGKEINREAGTYQAIAAPRGHAKSTTFTFKDDLHAILYQYKHYILILSDSSEQAEAFLEDIKTELEDNPYILEDFGIQKGDKAWRSGVILTKNDIKVEAIGSGKKVRGRKHRNWRPDLIVLDDIENDENVNTPEQRKKLKGWFNRAVSKAGDTYTDIMYIGTILHYDSLLCDVMKKPSYKTKKYQAVISFATRTDLWDEWEKIYTNLFNEEHVEDARTFYLEHEKEMLLGAEVLWEEKQSYYKLMESRISDGEAAFNSELQNDPIDSENATFNEEWFDWYESELLDFSKPNFLFVGSNDPSLGKNKKSDTSSIINLALDMHTGYMYVVDADIEKRKPDVIIEDIFELNRRLRRDYHKGFHKFGVETVAFQYFFKEVMAARSAELGEYLPIEEINSTVNKVLRIESLQPFIKNKYLKFRREHKTLIKQLVEFPMGKNDDAPDGLQMAVQLAQMIKQTAAKVDYKSIIKRKFKMGKGAY